MRCASNILAVGLGIALGLTSGLLSAQQVTIGSPFHTLGDNFFERMGVGFGGSYRGMNFSVGSYPLAIPQFGDPKTGAGLQTGFSIVGPKGQLNFAFDLSQGDSRTSVTQMPSVTIMNGQTGYVSDTSQTPFVISVIPVVGAFPPISSFNPWPTPQQLADAAGMPLGNVNPRVQAMRDAVAAAAADGQAGAMPQGPGGKPAGLAAKPRRAAPEPAAPEDEGPAGRLAAAQESTAGRPAPSVAEARRMRAQEEGTEQEEFKALFERGLAAEEAGKPGVAKVYYQQVARRASGELKDRALARLDELRGTAPSH
jgi:hypothetical protein